MIDFEIRFSESLGNIKSGNATQAVSSVSKNTIRLIEQKALQAEPKQSKNSSEETPFPTYMKTGLSTEEAAKKLQQYGSNEIPEKKVFILMCEEVKGEAQVCRFYGFEFPEQEVLPIKEIIEKRSSGC